MIDLNETTELKGTYREVENPTNSDDFHGEVIVEELRTKTEESDVKWNGTSFELNVKPHEIVYFQPYGINPKYCEVGIIHESNPKYIWYLDEPCKILKSAVKIIPKEAVFYNKKMETHIIKH